MKVIREHDPFGLRQRRVLRFSAAERRTLERAAEIADQARDRWRAAVTYDVDGEPLDIELAHISIGVDETAGGVVIEDWEWTDPVRFDT